MTAREDDPADQPIAFARSANSDVFGKLDAELPPVRIDSDTLVALHRLASETGMNVSEFVRTLARVRVWGLKHCQTVQAERLQRAMGNAEAMHSTGGAR